MSRTQTLFPVPQKYDPDEFLTASSDAKGHSEKFNFRAPNGLQRQVEIIMAARKFPYKTPSDLYRHALIRHLTWLGTLEPEVESVMGQVEAVMDLLRAELFHQEFIAVFEELGKVMSRYLAGGHTGEAVRTVGQMRDRFDKMPDGFWKNQYLAELRSRFGYLLSGESEGVRLTGGE